MAKVGQLSVDLEVSVAKFASDLEKARSRLNTFSAKSNKSLMGVAKGFKGVAGAVMTIPGLLAGGAFAGAIKSIADFGEQMSQVQAVSGATAREMELLREQAKQLGIATKFSAGEAAAGMAFLGQAGFNANQILAATPSMLQLAAAGGLGLAEAADIASNVMQAFGASANEAGRYADILAMAASKTNSNVANMGEAMKYVAPLAAALGVSVDEAAAAIGVLSNAGIKGSMAGTGLRRVLTSLANPTGELKELMGGLTVETDGFATVITHLRDRGIDAGKAMELFGDRGGNAFLVMQRGADDVARLTDVLSNSSGAAGDMADIMNDNLAGSFKQLISAGEGLILSLGDAGLTAIIRGVIDVITWFIRKLSELVNFIKDSVLSALESLAGGAIQVASSFGMIDDAVAQEVFKDLYGQADQAAKSVGGLNAEMDKLTKTVDMEGGILGGGSGSSSGGVGRAVESMTDLQRDAQQVIRQTRTDVEKYQEELAKLNMLYEAGAIDLETYNRAMEQAREQYTETAAEMNDLGKITDDILSSQINSWDDLKSVAVNALAEIIKNLIKTNQAASRTGSVLGGINTGFGSSGGSIFDSILGFGSMLFSSFHSGGVVGSGGGKRSVNPGVFAGAPRFHSGGLVGGEVPIIAKKGEMVLTEQQQRMMGGGSTVNVVINNNSNASVSMQQSRNGNNVTLEIMLDEMVAKNVLSPTSRTRNALDALSSRTLPKR